MPVAIENSTNSSKSRFNGTFCIVEVEIPYGHRPVFKHLSAEGVVELNKSGADPYSGDDDRFFSEDSFTTALSIGERLTMKPPLAPAGTMIAFLVSCARIRP